MLALRRAGVPQGAVEAGGDLRLFGPAVETVHVRDPRHPSRPLAMLQLRDGAVATSAFPLALRAGRERAMTPIIDPRSGALCRRRGSISVAAGSCVRADALTKVVALEGRGAQPLLTALHASAVIVTPGGRVTRLGAANAA